MRRPRLAPAWFGGVALVALVSMTSAGIAKDGWPPRGGTIIDGIVALGGSEPITRYELERATVGEKHRAPRRRR